MGSAPPQTGDATTSAGARARRRGGRTAGCGASPGCHHRGARAREGLRTLRPQASPATEDAHARARTRGPGGHDLAAKGRGLNWECVALAGLTWRTQPGSETRSVAVET